MVWVPYQFAKILGTREGKISPVLSVHAGVWLAALSNCSWGVWGVFFFGGDVWNCGSPRHGAGKILFVP